MTFLPLRSGSSGPAFAGTNQDDVLLWDVTQRAWYTGAAPGAASVLSWNLRTGAVVPLGGDYDSDQIDNLSGVPGASVSDALDDLDAQIAAIVPDSNKVKVSIADTTANFLSSKFAAGAGVGLTIANPGANEQLTIAAAPQPFRGTFNVNPLFVGTSTGSESNPFVSFAAAFAFAAAQGITAGIIWVPGDLTITENVVFPPGAGTNWEIACRLQFGEFNATIDGTIDLSCNGSGERVLTNLVLNKPVTGLTAAGSTSVARFGACFAVSTVTLTAGAGGNWQACFVANAPSGVFGEGGASNAITTVTGSILASHWNFFPDVRFSAGSEFYDCRIFGGVTSTNATTLNLVRLIGCNCLGGPFVLTAAAGGLNVQADGFSLSTMLGAITTTVGTVSIFPTNGAGNSIRQTLADNAGVFTLCNRYPTSRMVFTGTLTLLVPGTLGAAQMVVTYTDLTGVIRSKNVGATLNIAGAAGDEVSGELIFSQNGATNVQLQVAGIVTPGALSFSLGGGVLVVGN